MLSPRLDPSRPAFGEPRRALVGVVFAIILLTLLAYKNSLSGKLIFDDYGSIVDNATIRNLSDFPTIFSPPVFSPLAGRPFANFSFALNYWLNGAEPWSYHALNLLLHLGGALFLLGCVRRTFMAYAAKSTTDFTRRLEVDATWLAGLIVAAWAVHPLLTASVSYISQRTEVLMGFCYLGALYFFIRGSEKRPEVWLTCSVVACTLGVASKEIAATAPLVIALYDRTFVAGSFREAWRRRWPYYVVLMVTWLFLAMLLPDLRARELGFGLSVSWWEYALTETEAICVYLRLAFWPHPLIFDYGAFYIRRMGDALPFICVLVPLLVATGMALKRHPGFGFLAVTFFLLLAPTSSVIPIPLQPIAENRMYLPLAMAMIFLVLVAYWLGGRRSAFALGPLVVGMAFLTAGRNVAFQEPVALWQDVVAKRPQNPRAYGNLGYAFDRMGSIEALKWYKRAIELNPQFVQGHSNYAAILTEIGRVDEALVHAETAVRLDPSFAYAQFNLATALNKAGRHAEALRHAQQAFQLNPAIPSLHYEWGNALLFLGKPAEAVEHYRAELKVRPQLAEAHANLGGALFGLGRFAEAIESLQTAVRLKPGLFRAQHNLASTLLQAGQTEEAIVHYQAALRVDPQSYEAKANLGLAYGRQGDLARSEQEFVAALQLKPDYAPAVNGLAMVRAAQQQAGKP